MGAAAIMRHTTSSVFFLAVLSLAFLFTALPIYATPMQSSPCQAPEHRQFDFWVGDWEVHDPAGNVVGTNKVTREQDGCLLVEHWVSAKGKETGTSFNYYDIRDKKWLQLYLDISGYAGAFPAMADQFTDGKMVLISDQTVTPVFRWTWYVTSAGHVRQMAERSTDNQKTWKIFWDSVYLDNNQAAK
jgi:hypothetical protein